MLEIGEEETAAEVYELHPADVAAEAGAFFPARAEEDVLGLEVGVHDVVAIHQVQCLGDLHHEDFQLVLICHHAMD